MRIVFFSFYYPPDLGAGSFRSVALSEALEKKIGPNDQVHVITTHPNRYLTHLVKVDDIEVRKKITIHRISVPIHRSGMISQAYSFSVFAFSAFRLCRKLKPDFLIGTTSRLMTGILTSLSARFQRRSYYIDLRDIFSESISDLLKRRSRLLGNIIKPVLTFLEKRVLNSASGVNIVSEGFTEYFQAEGIDTSNWSFFPNGVDQEFLDFPPVAKSVNEKIKTILYAGNIGSGQGLETIIPAVAKRLSNGYRFVVVGDGSTVSLLRDAIKREGVNNVELLPPVGRSELVQYYRDSDILFLHLNNISAFRRVLPSKIFEYAALRRPIVAGLSGYSAKFLMNHIPSVCLFNPCDPVGAASCIQNSSTSIASEAIINNFVKIYSRVSIMDRMADHLVDIIECK